MKQPSFPRHQDHSAVAPDGRVHKAYMEKQLMLVSHLYTEKKTKGDQEQNPEERQMLQRQFQIQRL